MVFKLDVNFLRKTHKLTQTEARWVFLKHKNQDKSLKHEKNQNVVHVELGYNNK